MKFLLPNLCLANLSASCKHLQSYKDAFPELHKLYVTALVIGVSSASCESSFDSVTGADPLSSLYAAGKSQLVILAHEKSITRKKQEADAVGA